MNKELHTPFLCAAIRGYKNVCVSLIKSHANVYDTDANGQNFVHLAAERNYTEFLEVIN